MRELNYLYKEYSREVISGNLLRATLIAQLYNIVFDNMETKPEYMFRLEIGGF